MPNLDLFLLILIVLYCFATKRVIVLTRHTVIRFARSFSSPLIQTRKEIFAVIGLDKSCDLGGQSAIFG